VAATDIDSVKYICSVLLQEERGNFGVPQIEHFQPTSIRYHCFDALHFVGALLAFCACFFKCFIFSGFSSNSFTWVMEGGDFGTTDWGCLAGRCASLSLQAAHGGRAAGGSG